MVIKIKKSEKKLIVGVLIAIVLIAIFVAGFLAGRKPVRSLIEPETEEKTLIYEKEETEPSPWLKEHSFKAQNYTSDNIGLQRFTFNYSPELEIVVSDESMDSRRIRVKPLGEEVEESYYISLDEPGQSLGEGIRTEKEGEVVYLGNNKYTKHNVYYEPENRVVMVIYDPQPPLELGNIFISWWDTTRKQEALAEAEIILKTLRLAE